MSEDTPPPLEFLNPYNEEFQRDPAAMLSRLRNATPVVRSEDAASLAVLGAEQVNAILRDPDLWVDPRKARPETMLSLLAAPEGSEPSMLFSDDPRHRRLKTLVSASFTPRAIEQWRPRTIEIAAHLAEDLPGEFDLIERFAGPLPTWVIAEMLQVDTDRRDWFKHCSDATAYAFFNPMCSDEERALGEDCGQQLREYFTEQIELRRSRPVADGEGGLIGQMMAAQSQAGGEDALSDEDIIGQCSLLLIAGNITTTDLIGNGVASLLRHPDQWAELIEHPELLPQAVEELLRYNPPVQSSGRIASEAGELGGCPFSRGESFMVSLLGANFDPAVNPEPDRLDIRRERPRHWSFGGGRHFCTGAALARMEAQEALRVLTQKFPDLTLVEGGSELRTMPGFRGYTRLCVRTGRA
ncbi:MAG: cytochrome P450 [Gammaproteobacteria bacterium AqS3]|nr:cytochrome P450 [Gammaproteobacteria bacterium AqS3]